MTPPYIIVDSGLTPNDTSQVTPLYILTCIFSSMYSEAVCFAFFWFRSGTFRSIPVFKVMMMIKADLETACFAIFESVPVRFGLQEYVNYKNWSWNGKFCNFWVRSGPFRPVPIDMVNLIDKNGLETVCFAIFWVRSGPFRSVPVRFGPFRPVPVNRERKHAIKSRLGSDHLIFMRGGGEAGLEDVFGPGHFFFTRDAVLSFVYNTICTIEFNLS